MIQEYVVVRLKRLISTIPVPQGTKGTVLLVYPSDHPAYEVEFITDAGQSLGAHTIEGEDLEEVTSS